MNTITLRDGNEVEASEAVELYDGTFVLTNDAVELHDGSYAEEDVDELVELFDRRGRSIGFALIDDSDIVWVESADVWTLDSLTATCAGTDELFFEEELEVWNGSRYSEDWLNDNTFVCDCCGERYDNDNYGEDGTCEGCVDNNEDEENMLSSYSDRSANSFPSESNAPYRIGIELEVGTDQCDGIAPALNFCRSRLPDQYAVYKEDGSISSYRGFEIVTRPDAPAVHKRILAKLLRDGDASRFMRSWTYGTNNCGLHIHVERAKLSTLQIARVVCLVNDDSMKDIVKAVAGRYNNSYACTSKKSMKDSVKLARRKMSGGERYSAMNLNNEHTIEFRIFRGTVAYAGVLRCIEFVEAVLAYCKACSVSLTELSDPQNFLKFIKQNRADTPTLYAFLKKKNFFN